MAARKRRPSKLDPYMDKVGALPDRQVAEMAGVTAENVRAYRKRRGIPASWRGEGAVGVEPPKASTTKKKSKLHKRSKRRKSKLDPYMDKVGVVPDREVAELAGVSSENVRAFRKRRGIPASWRGEGKAPASAASKPKPKPTAAAPAKRAPKPRRGKLTPYRELVGILTDSRVAQMADTAAQNVRAYRLRHGIPARWRGEGEPLPNEEAILALHAGKPAKSEEPPAPPAVIPEPKPAAESVAGAEGYAVTVQGAEGEISYVVVANDIAEAAAKAVEGVQRRGIEGRLLSVRYLARTLGR